MYERYKNHIQALIDNELPETQRKRVFDLITDIPELRQYYDDLRHQNHLLKLWWKTDKKRNH
jgi:hypothetical protein